MKLDIKKNKNGCSETIAIINKVDEANERKKKHKLGRLFCLTLPSIKLLLVTYQYGLAHESRPSFWSE